MNKLLLALMFPLAANAAVWDRPSGGYTPTNFTANTTKYQLDRASGNAISSVKIDGDFNKAFQGLNDIEARVPASQSGQSGKFLTTDGSITSWGLVTSAAISAPAVSAGYVLMANGSGGVYWATVSGTSLGASGVTSGTYTLTSFQVNNSGIITSASNVGTVSASGAKISGTISATTISVSNSFVTSLTAGTISGSGAYKAMVVFSGTSSPSTVHRAENVSAVNRTGASTYNIVGTFPSTPGISCTPRGAGGGSGAVMLVNAVTPTTSVIAIRTYNTATGADETKDYVSCVIF